MPLLKGNIGPQHAAMPFCPQNHVPLYLPCAPLHNFNVPLHHKLISFLINMYNTGAVVIVWSLDLQLPVQSLPITTPSVVNSNPVHGEVYSIQHYMYMIKFVSDL